MVMAFPKSVDELMKQTDMLMYSAKQKGKNMIRHEVIQNVIQAQPEGSA